MANVPGPPLTRRMALLLALVLSGCIGPFSPSGAVVEQGRVTSITDAETGPGT